MINLNGSDYRLCMLDTNAMSELLIDFPNWFSYLESTFTHPPIVISISVFTLIELRSRKELFDKYVEVFSVIPSVVLDSHESILAKEIDNYERKETIQPVVIAPSTLGDKNLSPSERIESVLEKSGFISRSKYWKGGAESILDGMLSLKSNFPPKGKSYTKSEEETFVENASIKQIGMRARSFAKKILDGQMEFHLDRFPSVITTSHVVFNKFYRTTRKPHVSDVFDLIISAVLPYVDIFVTEGNLAEIVRQIQSRHGRLINLRIETVKAIKKVISATNRK